jgi:nitroimidazol reductase NimA-like FMN-containing flavoprotein (pyridoxamine 5'-phosphate oxidase superfamily)
MPDTVREETAMSGPPRVRRADKLMREERTLETLIRGFCGRLGTVREDGYPYVVPLLYVWLDGQIYTHNTRAVGHLRRNVDQDARVCFEVDEPGTVFPYGRFECDSSVSYRSAIAFGTIRIVTDDAEKARFCDALMAKYSQPDLGRPEGFYPRLGQIRSTRWRWSA